MSQSLKNRIGPRMRWCHGSLVGILVIMGLLAVPQPAAACSWYNPFCWLDEAFDYVWDDLKSVFELTWDILTLHPDDAWEDFKDIAENKICGLLTPLSLVISNGIEADFDECDIPPHPIEEDIRTKLMLYFKSSFDSVRIHEDCNLDGDVTPGSRSAITFGEHIYFKAGKYRPWDKDGFALLAHELIHVLQYRKKGFGDFTCDYAKDCGFGAWKSCAIEQDAYKYQALVLEDQKRDEDGVFTCSLKDQEWGPDGARVDSHTCTTDPTFLTCNALAEGPKPDYCKHLDNCPTHPNPGQEDSDSNMIGDACDKGIGWTAWTSEEKEPVVCGQDAGASGFACKGNYCDDVSLACVDVPSWTSLDYSTFYWSPSFSEEGKNSYSCNTSNGIVTGISCTGKYCDNISLACTKLTEGTLTNCTWSPWLSEEQKFFHFDRRFIHAVECQGSYCDNKRFQVCSLTCDSVSITKQPTNVGAGVGQAVTFSVTATGTNLRYQWRKNGGNIPGATAASYTIPAVSVNDAGSYGVTVYNECSTSGSTPATLTVDSAITITSSPASIVAVVGQAVTFSVTATGTNLRYQWRKNGSTIAGATAASYTIPAVQVSDNGSSYHVVVSNSFKTVTSGTATLTVNSAITITSSPPSAGACVGRAMTFSVTATGTNLRYQWRKNGGNIAGATAASYIIPAVQVSDAGSYSVVVYNGFSTVTSGTAILTVNSAITITSSSPSMGVGVGQAVTFSVTATGTNLRYQWRKNGGNIPGATTASYTIPAVQVSDAGSYSVVVYNGCSTVISSTAILTVNSAITITSQPNNLVRCPGQFAAFTVTATGTNLRYQWRKNGGNIPGATARLYSIPLVSPSDAGSYYAVVFNGAGMVNSATATLTINPPLTLSATSQSFSALGGSGTVKVNGSGCSWYTSSNVPWITVTNGSSGVGSGTVSFWVAANTGASRTGTMTIAGQTFTITQ